MIIGHNYNSVLVASLLQLEHFSLTCPRAVTLSPTPYLERQRPITIPSPPMAEPTHHHSTQSAPTEPDSALNDPDRWNQKYKAASARAIAQHPSDESSTTTTYDQPDILRIIPVSSEARRAFDSVVRSKQAGILHDNHAKYVQITGTAPLNAHTDPSNESGVTTDEDNQTLSAGRSVYEGYYSVRLSLLRVAPAPSWVCALAFTSSFSGLLSYSLYSSPAKEIPI